MGIRSKVSVVLRIFLLSLCFALDASAENHGLLPHEPPLSRSASTPDDEGIRFACNPSQFEAIESDMSNYLASLGITQGMVVKKTDRTNGTLVFTLNTPKNDTDTLSFKDKPELMLQDEVVMLPAKRGGNRKVHTVSKKEILLATLQHGRLTEFKDGNCHIGALKDHVGIRQNTVAWSEAMNLIWPEGGYAKWNKKYWQHGTPKPGVSLHEAIKDVFISPDKYSIGCYAAAKIVMIQGLLDYYRRIKKDPELLKKVESRLLADKEPLVDIEPGIMWRFEAGFDPDELNRPGKILKIQHGIAPRNFIPGDWAYLLNTDPISYQKTGYEGSNAIYMGRDKFVDLYNDRGHFYTSRQKIDEVYQWRNGVFSRHRDAEKIKPLSEQELERLRSLPSEGGLLMDFRVSHHFFGFNELPKMPIRGLTFPAIN